MDETGFGGNRSWGRSESERGIRGRIHEIVWEGMYWVLWRLRSRGYISPEPRFNTTTISVEEQGVETGARGILQPIFVWRVHFNTWLKTL